MRYIYHTCLLIPSFFYSAYTILSQVYFSPTCLRLCFTLLSSVYISTPLSPVYVSTVYVSTLLRLYAFTFSYLLYIFTFSCQSISLICLPLSLYAYTFQYIACCFWVRAQGVHVQLVVLEREASFQEFCSSLARFFSGIG